MTAPSVICREQMQSTRLDQFSFKTRRQIASRLQPGGLWMSKENSRIFLEERRQAGKASLDRSLALSLGAADYTYLCSESSFALKNYGMRARLPFIFAFGYDLGKGLHDLIRGDEAACEPVGQLCGLFNLGIALFDRTCDNVPNGAAILSGSFDDRKMVKLMQDPHSPQEFEQIARGVPNPEIRILLKIVCGFYSGLHKVSGVALDSDQWKRLGALLLEAYHAELCSMNGGVGDVQTLLAIAERKSTAPFEVMLEVARVAHGSRPAEDDRAISGIVRRIGGIFWRIDDLVDLSQDLNIGTLNAILVRATGQAAGSRGLADAAPANSPPSQERIEEAIDESIDQLASELAGIVGFLEARNSHAFRDLLLAYVRTWIN